MHPAVPGVLPLHPRRGPALLHEASLVDDENTAVGAQVFDGIGADVVANSIRVPAGVAQQALHRPGPGMGGLFGQLPAVLPLDTRQQPEQVGAGGRSGLHPPEPARDPGHDLIEHRPPTDRVSAMACGHRTSSGVHTPPDDHAMAVPVPRRVRGKIANPD